MQSIDCGYQYPAFSACAPGGARSEADSFQYLVCQGSNEEPGDDTGDQKCRCIVDQPGGHRDKTCDDELTDVVGNTSGNTDAEDAEAGFFLHEGHNCETECSAREAVENAEQVSKHKSDHDDADNGNKRSFFPGIFLENEEDCQIGEPELHSGNSGKERNQ